MDVRFNVIEIYTLSQTIVDVSTAGTGLPISIVCEVSAVGLAEASGVCAITGVAMAMVSSNSKSALDRDTAKITGTQRPRNGLPNQGTVKGDVSGAPPIDAGKQGKHVPGHNNNDISKSQWPKGQTGVHETQEGWMKGNLLPDGTKVWDAGKSIGGNGETGVRVHIDGKGNIHGYPVDPRQYLP